ncbi:hypothetical protein G6F22_013018 [Rhizopus arrhizus]|nr:hypothetical protein G6F22_013018 [Rhizopus arrhizus]
MSPSCGPMVPVALGFLDARAQGQAHMQRQCTGLGGREEVLAQGWQQREGHQHAGHETEQEAAPVRQCQAQQRVVAVAGGGESGFEALLPAHQRGRHPCATRLRMIAFMMVEERILGMMACPALHPVRTQQVQRHGRHQRARQHERAGHGEDHRQRHRSEQIAGDAVEQEHRHEHDADAQQRHECRANDLRGAIKDRLAYALALLQVPVDVLDGDGGIVDQDAHGQCQATQGHHIERLPGGGKQCDGRQHRQRNRGGDDHGRAPAAEEHQDHHAGQQRGDDALAGDAADRFTHEGGRIAEQRYLQRRRQGFADLRQHGADTADQGQGRGVAILQRRHQHRVATVDPHDVGLRRRAIAHVGDLADGDHRTVDATR